MCRLNILNVSIMTEPHPCSTYYKTINNQEKIQTPVKDMKGYLMKYV